MLDAATLVVWEFGTLSVELGEAPDGPTNDEEEVWAAPEPLGDKDVRYVYELCEWECFEAEATADELRVVVELHGWDAGPDGPNDDETTTEEC